MLKRFGRLSVVLVAASLILACASAFSIIKENPPAARISGYETIYVGWIDLREDDWKLYGFESKEAWMTVINLINTSSLQGYLKEYLPKKKIIGATSKSDEFTGQGDLYLKFTFNKINQNYNGFGGVDELLVDVAFIEGKTGKEIYSASIIATQAAAFPRNWKGASFDGRLDNEIYNLSWGLAEKIK